MVGIVIGETKFQYEWRIKMTAIINSLLQPSVYFIRLKNVDTFTIPNERL